MTVHTPPLRPAQPQHYHATPPLPPSAHSLANYAPPPIYPEPPVAKKKVFTPYVAAWSLLGGLAAGYLGYLVIVPDAHLPSVIASSDGRFAAVLADEVAGIKDSVAQVQLDLAKIKTDLAGKDARDKMLGAQLTALERRIGGDTAGVDDTAAQATAPSTPAKPGSKSAAPADVEAQAKAAPPPAQARLVNGGTTVSASDLGLETGSVPAAAAQAQGKAGKTAAKTVAATDPIDFGTAVVKPAGKPVGVQISSGASIDSLRLSWSLLSDRHPEALKNMEARYIARGDEAAPIYDLIAGPIRSKAEAQKVCKALAAKNVPCKVGDFLGEAL